MEDGTPLLLRDAISPDLPVVNNDISGKLFEKTDPDVEAMCAQTLEMACCAILLILERQCADQLPGGKFWDVGNAEIYQNVPSTNVISERDFAQLDLLLHSQPTACTLTIETLIMWVNNNPPPPPPPPPEWLNSLDPTNTIKVQGPSTSAIKGNT